eukprot:IDg1520t1
MDDKCTRAVMETFSDSSLVIRVESGLSPNQGFGLRLHDLVLLRCQQMAGNAHVEFHKRIVEAYSEQLTERGCKEEEVDEKCRPWWDVVDDGYVFAHLSRHLALCDASRELEFLLCDIRWTMRRMKFGEWVSFNVDFERLFRHVKQVGSGMRRVHKVLQESWSYARERHNVLAFYVFAHLSQEERDEKDMARLLSSIENHFPTPWLRPETRCLAGKDQREVWKEVFPDSPIDIMVDWTSENIYAISSKHMYSWSPNERQMRWRIPY